VQLAEREYRHPKDQATVLVLEGLARRGLLPSRVIVGIGGGDDPPVPSTV